MMGLCYPSFTKLSLLLPGERRRRRETWQDSLSRSSESRGVLYAKTFRADGPSPRSVTERLPSVHQNDTSRCHLVLAVPNRKEEPWRRQETVFWMAGPWG